MIETHDPTTRRTLGSYDRYADAQATVDHLSDEGFPVEHVTIVGTGLRFVERVTGRVTTGRAAVTGATQGAVLGVLFALLFGLFFAAPAFLGLLAYAVVLGAAIGAIFGAVGHAAQGGTRDFASVAGTQADRFEVQVDADRFDEAQAVLRQADPAPLTGAAAV